MVVMMTRDDNSFLSPGKEPQSAKKADLPDIPGLMSRLCIMSFVGDTAGICGGDRRDMGSTERTENMVDGVVG